MFPILLVAGMMIPIERRFFFWGGVWVESWNHKPDNIRYHYLKNIRVFQKYGQKHEVATAIGPLAVVSDY